MTLTPKSADGVFHQFPDGTNPAVIDKAMSLVNSPDVEPAVILNMVLARLYEILLGLNALQPGLEKDAGQTLNGLGLFTGKDRLN